MYCSMPTSYVLYMCVFLKVLLFSTIMFARVVYFAIFVNDVLDKVRRLLTKYLK